LELLATPKCPVFLTYLLDLGLSVLLFTTTNVLPAFLVVFSYLKSLGCYLALIGIPVPEHQWYSTTMQRVGIVLMPFRFRIQSFSADPDPSLKLDEGNILTNFKCVKQIGFGLGLR
jgi:hypothetical protein